MGGESDQKEKARLRKGINILISTPGKLLYHLQNTKSFKCDLLKYVIIDEADRVLDLGFEQTIVKVFEAFSSKASWQLKVRPAKKNLYI